MASILSVEQLQGLNSGSSPNTITVPAGQTLDVSSGSLNRNESTGEILQVQHGDNRATQGSSSTSFVDCGLSATITPKYGNTNMLVMVSFHAGGNSNQRFGIRIVRVNPDGSESIPALANAAGSRQRAHSSGVGSGGNQIDASLSTHILDTPGTSQQITYKVQMHCEASQNMEINRSISDSDSYTVFRTASQITVMEIKV